MEQALTLRSILRRLFDDIGVRQFIGDNRTFTAGVRHIEAALGRIAVEAADAFAHDVPVYRAVHDNDNYPVLNRLHVGVEDILGITLPPDIANWASDALAVPEPELAHEILVAFGRVAGNEMAPPPARALGRVALFEATRFNLLVLASLERDSDWELTLRDTDIDRKAAEEVEWWIQHANEIDIDVRPLHVILAACVSRLERDKDAIRLVMVHFTDAIEQDARLRRDLELRLLDMDRSDALLIRNKLAPALGEQHLHVEQLRKAHPLLYGGIATSALHMRTSRLMAKVENGEPWPVRDGPTFIDLIAERLAKGDL